MGVALAAPSACDMVDIGVVGAVAVARDEELFLALTIAAEGVEMLVMLLGGIGALAVVMVVAEAAKA